MSQDKWNELASINANHVKEKKGKFDYLSWTDAIELVETSGRFFNYELLPDTVFPDGSMEVRVKVQIDNETRVMWLAVTDFNNQAIKNPDAVAINKARMRCLVKGIAMHGLGFYIYQGEDLPMAGKEIYEDFLRREAENACLAYEWFMQLDEKGQEEVTNSAPSGKRSAFKAQLRDGVNKVHEVVDEIHENLILLLARDDEFGIRQIWDELTEFENELVRARMEPRTKQAIREIVSEGESNE